jgi:hypothetical protein
MREKSRTTGKSQTLALATNQELLEKAKTHE